MKIPADHPLALPGDAALIQLMRDRLKKPLAEQYVSYSFDAPNSRLIVKARDTSVVGEIGIYANQAELPYAKLNLGTVLPFPLTYRQNWNLPFRHFRQNLYYTYGLWLDAKEFAFTPDAVSGLDLDDPVNVIPDARNEVRLYALPASIRFQAGTALRLTVLPLNGAVDLSAFLDNSAVASLDALAYP